MDDKIKKSIRYSTLDGIFASVMLGASENFIAPYALAMKATVTQIGMLTALPTLVGSLAQLKTASVVDRLNSRMALIIPCVLAHTLMWVPLILIPYFSGAHAIWYLILFYTLYCLFNAFDMPAWSSLMADHVPEKERGSFFGWRIRLLGFISIGVAFAAGSVLNVFKDRAFLGFTVIFVIAFVSRLISWNYLRKMYDLPLTIREEHKFTFMQFVRRMMVSNFGRFVIFVSMMNFAVAIFSPFIPVYVLNDLHLDYVTYTVVTLVAAVTLLAVTKMWGVHADHVGNKRVLTLTSFFIPLVPIMWIPSHDITYLIAIQIFAGFFWAGFNLSAANFIYDAVSPEKRTRCIALYNMFNGCAVFGGAIIGGLLVKCVPALCGYKILTLALISGVLRALAALVGTRVREVRAVKKASNLDLFYSIIGLRPLIAREREE